LFRSDADALLNRWVGLQALRSRESQCLNRVLTGASGVSPEMALRLSKCLGRTPESWLAMQYSHDFWRAKQQVNLSRVGRVRLTAA